MSIQSEKVKRWRRETKRRIIESMGGSCICCGYNRCQRSLVLHHINPSEKEISFGSVIASPINWKSIVIELKKCVLLCSNCHGEIHDGILGLPQKHNTFDNKYLKYKIKKSIIQKECLNCRQKFEVKGVRHKFCSAQCSSKFRRKVKNRPSKNQLLKEIRETNYCAVGRKYGVSDNAIRKWLKS